MKPVKISDLYSFSFYGSLKTKGKNVVFMRAVLDEKTNTYRKDLMLCKGTKIQQLTSGRDVSSFVFEDARTIWFFQKEPESKKSRLYSLSLKGGEALPQKEFDFPLLSLIGFAGKDILLFLAQFDLNDLDPIKGGNVEVLTESPWQENGSGFTSGNRQLIYAYNTKTGELYDPAGENLKISAMTIYEEKLYFSAAPCGVLPAFFQDEIFEYDPKTRLLVSLARTNLSISSLNGMKDRLYLFGTDGKAYGLNENPDLYALNLHTRVLEKVMDFDESVGNSVTTDCAVLGGNWICEDQDRLFMSATIVSHNNLFCFEDGSLHQVLEWPGTIHAFGFSQGRTYFIGAKPGGLQELFMMEEGDVVQISDFQHALKDKYVAAARPVFYTGYESSAQLGWVLYPYDFSADRKYPAILDIHGGPKAVYGTVFFHEMQVWASRGYFVFFCNPFGSDGQGNAYADLRGKYGTIDYENLMTFTDAVLDAVPQIDPARLGVTGGSYGGFMTNWIITHTDRFAAAATQRSIASWISFWSTSDIGPFFTEDQIGARLDQADVLWDHSPMKHIAGAKTPTLVLHSDEDYRCPLEQGYQIFNGLLHQGVPARMVVFHQENHELSRSGKGNNRIRRLEEITRWMDSYLKGNTEYEAKL